MRRIYICTVGTGTAGATSNVAEGIMAAIKSTEPDSVLLLPSASEDSIAVAEYVREGVEQLCDSEIMPLSEHDYLEICRNEIRKILEDRKRSGDIITLNPTSGTKQMTTAAVLAAIDAEIEHIEYITGKRRDGVIITGEEQITSLNAKKFIAEKYLARAKELVNANSCGAASIMLEPYKSMFPLEYAGAMMLHHWRRLDYTSALRFAEHGDSITWKRVRSALATLRKSDTVSIKRIVDLANYAELCVKNHESEEALAIIYRLVESSAKLRLKELNVDCETLDDFAAITGHPGLRLSSSVANQLTAMGDNGNYHIGLRLALEILASTNFAFVENFLRVGENWRLLQKRNKTRYGHGCEFVNIDDVGKLLETFTQSLRKEWKEAESFAKVLAYPTLEELIREE